MEKKVNNILENAPSEVIDQIVKFAIQRYGTERFKLMGKKDIAVMCFKEFVDYEDWSRYEEQK